MYRVLRVIRVECSVCKHRCYFIYLITRCPQKSIRLLHTLCEPCGLLQVNCWFAIGPSQETRLCKWKHSQAWYLKFANVKDVFQNPEWANVGAHRYQRGILCKWLRP